MHRNVAATLSQHAPQERRAHAQQQHLADARTKDAEALQT